MNTEGEKVKKKNHRSISEPKTGIGGEGGQTMRG